MTYAYPDQRRLEFIDPDKIVPYDRLVESDTLIPALEDTEKTR